MTNLLLQISTLNIVLSIITALLSIITAIFTGILADIGRKQFEATVKMSKESIKAQKTAQLNELMIKKANDCNNFFPYGNQSPEDDEKTMHCISEIWISIQNLNHLLLTVYQELDKDKDGFKKLFWINLNTRIREFIIKNEKHEIPNLYILEEYKIGHNIKLIKVKDYFDNEISSEIS